MKGLAAGPSEPATERALGGRRGSLSGKNGMNMAKRYYIAYGNNLNIPQTRMRCPGARIIGTSVIEDYELLFKGSKTGSYLTIEPKAGASVPVAVWEVTEQDELALDRYTQLVQFLHLPPHDALQFPIVRFLRKRSYIQ